MSVHTRKSWSGRRWGYVINGKDGSLFISRHIYGSAEAAQKAGEEDERKSEHWEQYLESEEAP